ncbi:hypothetical protein TRM7615_01832 [Falsiruegeria mediterranea M17]|uniref:Uncharacterized protein n=1 Tax=Falsiruegeria mediterranea M17 TaxID=1200281 RepID=A0A2R8C7L3_9RHOB|nr:hypothetical protein TRM7615_01832 [Falsiruegeria mediterranea M17]
MSDPVQDHMISATCGKPTFPHARPPRARRGRGPAQREGVHLLMHVPTGGSPPELRAQHALTKKKPPGWGGLVSLYRRSAQSNLRDGASTIASPIRTFLPSTEQWQSSFTRRLDISMSTTLTSA